MNEVWKPINSWPYEVSNQGQIRRSVPGPGAVVRRILKPQQRRRGYPFVRLTKNSGNFKNYTIHRLVLEIFVGPCPPGMEANHKDGDKTNNLVENLEWVTRSANEKHAFRLGLMTPPSTRGSANGSAKLTEKVIPEIRRLLRTGEPQREIAQKFGVSQVTISDIKTGKGWKHV